jgi:hypothetical protein
VVEITFADSGSTPQMRGAFVLVLVDADADAYMVRPNSDISSVTCHID